MARSFLFLPALLMSAFVAMTNPQSMLQHADAYRQAQKTDSQVLGKKIYSRDCAMCHGNDGSGRTDLARDMHLILPDWTDQKTLVNTPDDYLLRVIRTGKGKMPPEESARAKDEDVKNMIAYIRSFSKGQVIVAAVDLGR